MKEPGVVTLEVTKKMTGAVKLFLSLVLTFLVLAAV